MKRNNYISESVAVFNKITKLLSVYCFCIVVAFSLFGCKSAEQTSESKPTTQNPRENFKNLFHQAMSEKMIGNYDRALVLFQQCLTIENNNSAVYFALSDLYEKQGNPAKAIENAQLAYDYDTSNKWYALRLAELYYSSGNFDQSVKYYELSINAEEEQSLEFKYDYADALIRSGQYEKAIPVLNEIEVETGKYPELSIAKYEMYMILKQPENANAEFESLFNDDYNGDHHLIVAGYYMDIEQYALAEKVCRDVLVEHPNKGEANFMLGEVLLRQNKTDEAIIEFKKGFANASVMSELKIKMLEMLVSLAFDIRFPDSEKIHSQMNSMFDLVIPFMENDIRFLSLYGKYLQDSGQPVLALDQYKLVSQIGSTEYSFWKNLLELELRLHRYEDLARDGQKAVELFPSLPQIYLYTGIGLYRSQKFNEAEELFYLGKDLIINDNSLLIQFHGHMAVMFAAQNNFTEALSSILEAKKKDENSIAPYAFEAEVFLFKNDVDAANNSADIGLSMNGEKTAHIYDVKGRILLIKKDYSGAVKYLSEAVVKDPNDGFILEDFGDALFLNGQIEDAVAIWKEAQSKGNTSDKLQRKITDKKFYE